VGVIGTAPAQALARMHAVVAHGFVADIELGRPRATGEADDALRIGGLPGPQEVSQRMAGLCQVLVESTAPGILVASIAHAEVASVRPFGWGSGLVARALVRLVLAQRGVDPGMLAAPELGLRAAGRPAYVRAVRAYAEGTPESVAGMVALVAAAVEVGAREPSAWVAASPG
jgi:Fic family protein